MVSTIILAILLLGLLLLRIISKSKDKPEGYTDVWRYEPTLVIGSSPDYQIFARCDSDLKLRASEVLNSVWFKLLLPTVRLLFPRVSGALPEREFLKNTQYYILRPEQLGLVFGFAQMLDESGRTMADDGCEKLAMRIGIEWWWNKVPYFRFEALNHEMLHGAQEAYSEWLTANQRRPEIPWRKMKCLWAELHAAFFGSPITYFVILAPAFVAISGAFVALKAALVAILS